MKFKWSDYLQQCNDYSQNAPTFKSGVQFVQSGIKDDDVMATLMWLRRKNERDNTAFLLCDSTTDSHGCTAVYQKTDRRGRPQKKIIGKKVGRHIHGLLISQSIDASVMKEDVTNYLTKRRKRFKHLKQQKVSEIDGIHIVKYDIRQADHIYKSNDFDFEYFNSELYFTPYKDDDFS